MACAENTFSFLFKLYKTNVTRSTHQSLNNTKFTYKNKIATIYIYI